MNKQLNRDFDHVDFTDKYPVWHSDLFQSFRENHEYAEALGVISIVGLSFSILGLVITIIHHIKER